MELQYYGANCVRLSTKKAAVVIDDNLIDLGVKAATKPGDIALFTTSHGKPKVDTKIVIDKPGEYEVADISIQGIAARAHMDASGEAATIYKLVLDGTRIAVIGHVYPELSSSQLEALSTIDILIIPVGGNGYTLDPIGAHKLIKEIEPKIIIPTHYDDKALKYEVPQQPLEEALKGLALESVESVAKLKIKSGEFPETAKLVILERQ